jgi:hypothetical protein
VGTQIIPFINNFSLFLKKIIFVYGCSACTTGGFFPGETSRYSYSKRMRENNHQIWTQILPLLTHDTWRRRHPNAKHNKPMSFRRWALVCFAVRGDHQNNGPHSYDGDGFVLRWRWLCCPGTSLNWTFIYVATCELASPVSFLLAPSQTDMCAVY